MADMVRTAPSSGPAQKPASPYTAPSANTDKLEEMLIRPDSRWIPGIVNPLPSTVSIPKPIRTSPPTRANSLRWFVTTLPSAPTPAPIGIKTADRPIQKMTVRRIKSCTRSNAYAKKDCNSRAEQGLNSAAKPPRNAPSTPTPVIGCPGTR